MTLERDHAADLFGLAGTFPRPGWIVLDAARDHRFTGELVFDVEPEIRVYLDRGKIYLAERATDPSLGARLVDAGALNAAQLEHGSMRIGDAEHLGRLFERVPSVDRQATLLTTELMNEACVAWLAGQHVRGVVSTPYRHHPTGIHRWDRPADAIDLSPGDPLPAPPPTEAPCEIAPPESIFSQFSNDTDPVIHWDEPSWLDDRLAIADRPDAAVTWADETTTIDRAAGDEAADPDPADHDHREDAAEGLLDGDWVDRLERDGLPAHGSDPLAPRTGLPPIALDRSDRFEVIWPSGEIDSEFPAGRPEGTSDDHDRAGPTARVGRTVDVGPTTVEPPDDSGLWDVEATGPSFGPPDEPTAPGNPAAPLEHEPVRDEVADDSSTENLALSMRRAVASIETGSLAARRRLSDSTLHDSSRGTELAIPGRVATRNESSVWSSTGATADVARSVFDEPGVEATRSDGPSAQPEDTANEPERVSALRRLIGGLRRR